MARAKGAIKNQESKRGRPPKHALVRCTRCGKEYGTRNQNFSKSQSPLYVENDKFLPVCKSCINELYENYRESYQDDRAAIRRICMMFDLYWSDEAYNSIKKTPSAQSNIMAYIRVSGLRQFNDKTFDNTLEEESRKERTISYMDAMDGSSSDREVSPEIIEFWGSGLTPSYYRELEQQLKKWTEGRDMEDIDIGEITVIKKICLLEVMINQDIASGNNKSVEKNVRALDALLGSANLKPVQLQQQKTGVADEKDAMTPFGVWIRKIEDDRPIPEPEEQFKDVDGIAKYISVWFLGHLSKVLNINNRYSNLYEEEIAELTVERPEYEGYDDEEILEDIFERAKKESEVEAKRTALGEDNDGGNN